jgi:hypothetical protein
MSLRLAHPSPSCGIPTCRTTTPQGILTRMNVTSLLFFFAPFSPHEYGSFTTWHTDTRTWVGTEDMITYEVPGMVFFVKTGGYDVGDGENYAYKHSMGKWFRQVIPTGSQIDLLRQEIGRYHMCHVCETEQISDWQITFSSTGFHLPLVILRVTLWRMLKNLSNRKTSLRYCSTRTFRTLFCLTQTS